MKNINAVIRAAWMPSITAIALSGAGVGSQAQAQAAAPEQPKEDQSVPTQRQSEARAPNTIVVTAQRRSENIQDVPVSLTGLSGEALQRDQTFDNIQLARSVPNFDVRNTGVPISNIFIRGVGNNDFNQTAVSHNFLA